MDSLRTKSHIGVSLSEKYCAELQVPYDHVLDRLLQAGFGRFRLMSYWDSAEPIKGEFNFSTLDRTFKKLESAQATVTLCLGQRQPRWPETHLPAWVKELNPSDHQQALENFITEVVERYSSSSALESYQLENEALNRGMGLDGDFSRERLRNELTLVKALDPKHPVIMTTSNTWGLPIRRPRPDIYGFSLYTVMHRNNGYVPTKLRPWVYDIRRHIIQMYTLGKPSFIHELQCEPWGPASTTTLKHEEQDRSMSVDQLAKNLDFAAETNLLPIDLWGGEWWVQQELQGRPEIIKLIETWLKEQRAVHLATTVTTSDQDAGVNA